jgi:DNA-binding beta-propeller fold protein YncE
MLLLRRVVFVGLMPIFFALASCVTDPSQGGGFDGPTTAIVGPDGRLYVADGYYNSRIAVFTKNGDLIASWGSSGYGRGQFHNPHSLAFGVDGTLLVADRDNGRIQRFHLNGDYVDEWSGAELGRPWGISVAGDGTIFSVDGGDQDDSNPRSGVVRLSSDGRVLCRFSTFGSNPGELNWGHAIAVSRDAKEVFVVDFKNTRVQKFVTEDHLSASKDSSAYRVDATWPAESISHRLDPLGLALDDSLVYITQQAPGAPIVVLRSSTGEYVRQIDGTIFRRAHGITVDVDHTLWVTDVDGNSVVHIAADGTVIRRIAAETE